MLLKPKPNTIPAPQTCFIKCPTVSPAQFSDPSLIALNPFPSQDPITLSPTQTSLQSPNLKTIPSLSTPSSCPSRLYTPAFSTHADQFCTHAPVISLTTTWQTNPQTNTMAYSPTPITSPSQSSTPWPMPSAHTLHHQPLPWPSFCHPNHSPKNPMNTLPSTLIRPEKIKKKGLNNWAPKNFHKKEPLKRTPHCTAQKRTGKEAGNWNPLGGRRTPSPFCSPKKPYSLKPPSRSSKIERLHPNENTKTHSLTQLMKNPFRIKNREKWRSFSFVDLPCRL